MRTTKVIAIFSILTLNTIAGIISKEVTYSVDTTVFKGFLAYDDAKTGGKLPGVLVVHEWWGLNEFAKAQARDLAKLGYVAFAVDMYGNGYVAPDVPTAMKMAGGVRGTPLMRTRVIAGFRELLRQKNADSMKIAAIGFCFGGTSVLELAYSGAPVKGVVSFHGGIIKPFPQDLGAIKAKILVLHGADDPNVPAESIVNFQEAMRKARADWQMIYYGNTVHSFTNPAAGNDNGKGAAYNPVSAKRAFDEMQAFLREIFGPDQGAMTAPHRIK